MKRATQPLEEELVTDIKVVYGEIDTIPDGYDCIYTTTGGFPANLNEGTPGVPMFICYSKSKGSEKPIFDVSFLLGAGASQDPLPTGYTKVSNTPLGMDANIFVSKSNDSMYLCYNRRDVGDVSPASLDHPINGEYDIADFHTINLFAVKKVAAKKVDGSFGPVPTNLSSGSLHGFLYEDDGQFSCYGYWNSTGRDYQGPLCYPFHFKSVPNSSKVTGWWSGSNVNSGGPWNLIKDCYIDLAYKKDYGSEWQNNELVATERISSHKISSLIQRFVSSRTLAGENMLECSQCEKKTESRTHTVIYSPPEHLILTIKRMYYDWKQQKTCKSLHDVVFPSYIELPDLSEDEASIIFNEERDSEHPPPGTRAYGLYGVLVHSGLTANSGHYFSFCRSSSAAGIHREDSPYAPWIKFNDSTVTMSTWKEMQDVLRNSVSNTAYLLLYKRLTYTVHDASSKSITGKDPEVDEAMELAKAMALSMAESSNDAHHHHSNNTNGDQDPASIDTEGDLYVPELIKQVERENWDFIDAELSHYSSEQFVEDLHAAIGLTYSIDSETEVQLHQLFC